MVGDGDKLVVDCLVGNYGVGVVVNLNYWVKNWVYFFLIWK